MLHDKGIRIIKISLNITLTALFVILILSRDVFGVSVNIQVFSVLPAIFFAINNMSLIVAAMAFMMPSYTGIPQVTVYLIGAAIIILKYAKDMRFNPVVLLSIMLIVILEILSGFNQLVSFDMIEFLRLIGLILGVFVIIPSYRGDLDYVLVLKAFILGVLFMAVNILWQYLQVYSVADFITLGIRVGNTVQDFKLEESVHRVSNNQNLLGVFYSTAICTALVLRYKNSAQLFSVLTIPAFILLGLLTQSRSFVLTALLVFACFLFIYAARNKTNVGKTVTTVLVSIVLLVGAIILLASFFPQYLENLMGRFEAEDITGGRSAILTKYNEFMRENSRYLLLGTGLQNYRQLSEMESIHNGIQQVFVSWGVVGCVVVALLMIAQYKVAVGYSNKFDMMRLLPMITYLFPIQAMQWFSSNGIILLSLIWFYSVRLISSEQEELQEEIGGTVV